MVEKFQLSLILQGFECNGYPKCRITFNDQILYDSQIIDTCSVNCDITLEKTNIIKIEQYDKKFGENGIWDTKLENGKIVQDKYIIIRKICIDNINLQPWWHFGLLDNEIIFEHQNEIGLYKNSTFNLKFDSPLYDWLICKKSEGFKEIGPAWKKSSLNSFADGYSITIERFEELIAEAKQLLKKL